MRHLMPALLCLAACVPEPLSAPQIAARDFFAQQVAPPLIEACAGCHQGRMGMMDPFLIPGEEYDSIRAYRGKLFLTDPPEWSLLLNRGRHTGPALTSDQYRFTYEWLLAELHDVQQRVRATAPVLIGPGEFIWSLKLLVGDPQARITFQVTPLPGPGRGLRLSQLQVTAGPETGIKLRHPLLALITQEGVLPDPADGLSTVDLSVPAGAKAPLGTGEVLLPEVPADATLQLLFETIERAAGSTNVEVKCKAKDVFAAKVQPILSASCLGCHGGGNPLASKAFDMRAAASQDPAMIAQLCLDVRARVDLMMPERSLLLRQVTRVEEGGLPNHPLKLPDPGPLRAAVLDWAPRER